MRFPVCSSYFIRCSFEDFALWSYGNLTYDVENLFRDFWQKLIQCTAISSGKTIPTAFSISIGRIVERFALVEIGLPNPSPWQPLVAPFRVLRTHGRFGPLKLPMCIYSTLLGLCCCCSCFFFYLPEHFSNELFEKSVALKQKIFHHTDLSIRNKTWIQALNFNKTSDDKLASGWIWLSQVFPMILITFNFTRPVTLATWLSTHQMSTGILRMSKLESAKWNLS